MKLYSVLLCLLLTLGSTSFAQKQTLSNLANDPAKAEFKFDVEEHNFGTIKQGDAVTYEFKFSNTGNEPLIITNAEGSCGCTVPVYPKQPILKGQEATIKVTFNSAGKSGMQDKTVTITSNAKQNPMVLHMKGNVDKVQVPSDAKK